MINGFRLHNFEQIIVMSKKFKSVQNWSFDIILYCFLRDTVNAYSIYIGGRICAKGLKVNRPEMWKMQTIFIYRLRLQRRLYGICLVRFLSFRFPCRLNWFISVLNHLVNQLNTYLNAKTKIISLNRHIFRVLGRLYSLVICG